MQRYALTGIISLTMLFSYLSFAPLLLFISTVLCCYTQFCKTSEERDAVERIVKKISPLPWPECFHALLNYVDGDEDVRKLTELQMQNPFLGDERLIGGYFELELRNISLYKDGLRNENSNWERHLLLRMLLFRRPISFKTERGKLVGATNTFESFLHIAAVELETDLLLRQKDCRALLNIQVLVQRYFSFRSDTARKIVSLPVSAKFDLVG